MNLTSEQGSGLFLRKATGLTREFGIADAIWTNLGLVGVFFSLTFIASTGPLIGGDPVVGGIIALIGMFFVAIAFAAMSIITPRTASDYVFTSRYLNPALGFVGNAGYYVSTVPLFMGITITTIESFGFSALFAYVGLATGNQGMVNLATTLSTNPYYELAVGGILTILVGMIPLLGYRVYRWLNNVILPLILVAVAVMFYVLATTPTSVALQRLTALSGNPNLIANVTAVQPVSAIPVAHGLGADFALNAVYVVGFAYIISAIYIAGEVRQVKRNMPIAIVGTLIITLIIFAGATILSYNTFGYNFLSNLYTQTIALANPAGVGLPLIPYLDFLTAAISNNVYIGGFIIIVVIIQLLWYQTNAVFVGGRLLLSYSFDRIMPSFMGDVSDRLHVPAKAMIVSLIIGLLAGLVFVFPSTAAVAFLMSSAAVAILLLFPITVVGIALLVFRYQKSAQFKASSLSNSYLGGPLYVIAAVITIIYSIATFVEYIITPAIFPTSLTEGLELIFIPIAILFVIYYVSRAINASRGVKFNLIFKEIPPE
ncbi:MAG TPA: amino acid permease [Nitrososphaerales archaeon]|nr:amino acid permease [Nitrososphaerales archaeon]